MLSKVKRRLSSCRLFKITISPKIIIKKRLNNEKNILKIPTIILNNLNTYMSILALAREIKKREWDSLMFFLDTFL